MKHKNKVIVVGGCDKEAEKSSEWYDFDKAKWYYLPSTNTPHRYNPCLSNNNGILVVLGDDGTTYKKQDWGSIEFYDERDSSNKWQTGKQIAQSLNFDGKKYNTTFEQILSFSV